MKGLSPYFMVEATVAEIEEENELADAIDNASSTTVKDLQSLLKRKATVPGSFQLLIVVLRTNLLYACKIWRKMQTTFVTRIGRDQSSSNHETTSKGKPSCNHPSIDHVGNSPTD